MMYSGVTQSFVLVAICLAVGLSPLASRSIATARAVRLLIEDDKTTLNIRSCVHLAASLVRNCQVSSEPVTLRVTLNGSKLELHLRLEAGEGALKTYRLEVHQSSIRLATASLLESGGKVSLLKLLRHYEPKEKLPFAGHH